MRSRRGEGLVAGPAAWWIAGSLLIPALAGGAAPGRPSGPSTVVMEPVVAPLVGRHASAQMILTEGRPDGSSRDLTREASWTSLDPTVAAVSPRGLVSPRGNGKATIVARAGSSEVRGVVAVRGMDAPAPVSFRRDVIPAFSQAGCNTGSCHGTPTGKGGFRLSLRGYLPDEDFLTLTREASGRRINATAPDDSLLLRKPLGEIPHEGGLRFDRRSEGFELVRAWIAEGAHDVAASPAPAKLEIVPGPRVLVEPADSQQIAVRLRHDDGSVRDVTTLCYFDSSNAAIAEVNPEGLVRFRARGEVAIIAHYLSLVANVRLTHLVRMPGFAAAPVAEDDVVDHAVFSKLNRMQIPPSPPCTDGEFLRRAYLDVIGVLPTPAELDEFLRDGGDASAGAGSDRDARSLARRERVVDALLRRPEFHDFWALKLADVLRSNGRLIKPKGALAYHRWIRAALERDMPMDEFARALLTTNGSTYAQPAANYYRTCREPEAAVEATAQLFMGVRIGCAKCHNHPFERWTQDDYYGFAAFFSQVGRKKGNQPEEEVIFSTQAGEVRQPRTGRVMKPKALGGPVLDGAGPDRRVRLASWLTGAENPFFARCLVNRVWYHLMGRGIVEPVDDFRDSNPPSNDELLDGLARRFVHDGYSLKRLIRTIVLSRTYALSSGSTPGNADDEVYFSHAATRMLPAEVLLDAISAVTGTATTFEGLPRGSRAAQIPDGKLDNPFLKTFGRPARELTCECERECDPNLSEALQLIGGATVNGKLHDDHGRVAGLAASGLPPEDIARQLYRAALTREPSPGELEAAVRHLRSGADLRPSIEDLGWALINSKEFLFRH
ncbi:Bacterial Ig-like domain (group 2) [Aquisphaera giovannonii]|uniref:Bacterial Ig-like domain (Group 2) n=1 Tax=Aquisphaera giovannonii TaxID=406548 RepID=A0A5B9WD51_9BACT|nr:DUF1553 domain-containing protein [Aquisphaera giovannonii]QEH37871.1 Bacterial Ig-like domain (group 2) [Aquisphaera giovannonii]